MVNPGGFGPSGGEFHQCDKWHTYAIAIINHLRPDLVIVTQETHGAPGNHLYTSAQWQQGLTSFFAAITVPSVHFEVIGNMPDMPTDPSQCLDEHSQDVPACSAPVARVAPPNAQAEEQAVAATGGRYVDVMPWFCSTICSAIVGKYQVYFNQQHVMGSYALSLEGVMAEALQLPTSAETHPSTKVPRPSNAAVPSG